jgi:translation initiation factor 2 alpha subunit (eIF-2alpha)
MKIYRVSIGYSRGRVNAVVNAYNTIEAIKSALEELEQQSPDPGVNEISVKEVE